MDFINDNLIWLIIIAVVLILAIIGYIAEKNGFGNNNKKTNKDEDALAETPIAVEEPKVEEPVVEEPPVESDELSFENSLESDDNQDNEEVTEEAPIDISSELEPDEDFTFEDETTQEASDDVSETEDTEDVINFDDETKNDESEEISFEDEKPSEDKVSKNDDIEDFTFEDEPDKKAVSTNTEDLYAPFGDQEFTKGDLNIDQDFNEILNDVDKTTGKSNTSNDDTDDDIWKF